VFVFHDENTCINRDEKHENVNKYQPLFGDSPLRLVCSLL